MNKLSRRFWSAAGIIVALALVLSCGVAFARYLETFSEDQGFWAKPPAPLEIRQSWKYQDDAHTITFTAGEYAANCRVFLAVSQGVTAPETLQVELTMGDSTLVGQPERIEAGSALDGLFGPGVIFRFYDADGQEVQFDLTRSGPTLRVRGLDSAAEATSLLRLFVENVPQ